MGALPTQAHHAVYEQNGAVSASTRSTVPSLGPCGSRHRRVAVDCQRAVKCTRLKARTTACSGCFFIPNFGGWPLLSAPSSIQFAENVDFFFPCKLGIILLKIAQHCPFSLYRKFARELGVIYFEATTSQMISNAVLDVI